MKIAITGGIAEGKSTVLGIIAARGVSVASADEMARQVFQRPEVQAELGRILGAEPPILPAALREAIAASDDVRRRVNARIHPLVAAEIRASRAAFVEVPLLIETCLHGEFDRIWVVTCGVVEQRRRLLARYGDRNHASALIASQLPTKLKIAFADRVVRTNSPIESVTRIVSEAVSNDLA